MKLPFKINGQWDYENGFYLTSDKSRIPKLLGHFELYKKIAGLPGHVIEFGVYKGVSFIQWLTFRDMLESVHSRRVIGFDIFGKFPDQLKLDSDRRFVEKFEHSGGDGIDAGQLEQYLKNKNFENYALISGDILTTLPAFLDQHPEFRYSLVHIDVDVYEPTKKILELIIPKIVRGGIIVLDDYGSVEGETLAVEENDLLKKFSIQKLPISHTPSYIQIS